MRITRTARAKVSAHDLIEDYQGLRQAVNEQDWSLVETVMECLAQKIEAAEPSDGLRFVPSASSIVLNSCESGIISHDDGSDILCAEGTGVSEILRSGSCACDESCPRFNVDCFPESLDIRLENQIHANLTKSTTHSALFEELAGIE